MEKHIIFFDLDGTLVENVSKVNDKAREMIEALQKNDHLCFVATGRGLGNVPECLLDVMDGFITLTGACCRIHNDLVFEHTIDKEKLNEFVLFCCNNNIPIFLENDNEMNLLANNYESLIDPFRMMEPYTSKVYKTYEQYKEDVDFAVSSLGARVEDLEKINEYLQKHKELQLMDSGQGWYEIHSDNVNKGNAIVELTKSLEMNLSNAICVGDSDNDSAMFDVCGTGIAVSNALESIKKKATVVLEGNTRDGLYDYFRKSGLL